MSTLGAGLGDGLGVDVGVGDAEEVAEGRIVGLVVAV